MSARDDLVAEDVAELLLSIGWKCTADAQWHGLTEAIPKLRALLALLDAEPVAWIPVNERLPERNTTVLVDGGIAQLDGDDRWVSLTGIDWPGRPIAWRVTHWMPLPARPEASDE